MKFSTRRACMALALALAIPAAARSQAVDTPSDAELNKEAVSANALYLSQNFVGALPLYEDLHKRQPESNLWRERLAMCLLGPAPSDSEMAARRERAHKLLLEARAAGDNSNLLQVVLEKLEAPAGAAPAAPSPGLPAFQQAEKAFSSGDLPAALKLYEQSAAADPKFYEAPLYAGDAEFKQQHYAEADKWYARAVAINPDRETAYRYWGDCLMKQGDPAQAEGKFIDAIIAEPYSRTPRVGLKQWADQTHALLIAPPIALPARPTVGANGSTNVTVDPTTMNKPGGSAWLMYSLNGALWQKEKFSKQYPAEKQYRHSLAEEVDSLRLVLTSLKEQKIADDKLDASLHALKSIDADGMLECYILLDRPDQGIAQDYVAFRAQHRDLLHAYMAKYDVHPH